MWLKAALALGLVVSTGVSVPDIEGGMQRPFQVRKGGKANVLFFVTHDCPISNAFAKEIARICPEYAAKGIGCSLVYTDPSLTDEQAGKHAADYSHGNYPKIVDRKHLLVKAAGATITPEAVIVDAAGKIRYRGRIDDSFAALGQPRRPVRNADVRNALDDLIAGREVRAAETRALGCYITP